MSFGHCVVFILRMAFKQNKIQQTYVISIGVVLVYKTLDVILYAIYMFSTDFNDFGAGFNNNIIKFMFCLYI